MKRENSTEEDKIEVVDQNGNTVFMTQEELSKWLAQGSGSNSPYKRVDEPQQFNYSLKRYVVRGGKNVIHKANYESCNSAQYIYDYLDFDTAEEALAYGAEHFPEMGGFRKCKLCFGGKSFFKSRVEKAGGQKDTDYRDEIWEEEWEERKG
ncbi:MAG: hypothetical protein LUJ25_01075 [Firmicutes bacterium]|nr:hypothetical protein [Bacillota bacterium]